MKKLKLYIPVIALLSLVACKKAFSILRMLQRLQTRIFIKPHQTHIRRLLAHMTDCNVYGPVVLHCPLLQSSYQTMHLAEEAMPMDLAFR